MVGSFLFFFQIFFICFCLCSFGLVWFGLGLVWFIVITFSIRINRYRNIIWRRIHLLPQSHYHHRFRHYDGCVSRGVSPSNHKFGCLDLVSREHWVPCTHYFATVLLCSCFRLSLLSYFVTC